MAKKKIGAYITLDGEKEFRSATSACNKSLATMKSEMKLVEAQTVGSANTLDTLRKKHDVLSRTLDEQEKKEETIRNGLKHAEEQYEKAGGELDDYRKKLEQAQSTLDEMKNSSDTTKESLETQQNTVEQLSHIVEKGETTYQKAGVRVQDWKKQLNNAEAQTIRATKALNENDAYLKEAEKSYKKCAKSIDEFGNDTDTTIKKLAEFKTVLKANLANTAVEIGKDALTSAVQGTLELDSAQRQLQASTGATAAEAKEYNAEMQSLYTAGYADSIDGIANAMSLVKQYTNETDSSKIKELAENAMVMEETFGMDLSESIRGADALITTMGVDSETAFDLMAKGAQNGLNKSGELADNLAEYAPLWSQAGFSAEEMFAILENGLDSGAYNLDKVNDYVKEFGNSLADGRIEQNLSAFSGDTQNLFYAWKNGEATTKEVFQSVISDLASMENQQQALTIASNTWSALGEDNAMKVITSLNNANTAYANVHGTMEEIKNIKYDSVTNQWKVLGRTFQTDVMTPMLKEFLPVAKSGLKLVSNNIDGIIKLAKIGGPVIGAMFVVKKSNALVTALKNTEGGIAKVITKVTAHTVAKGAETVAETASAAAKTAETVAETAGTAAKVGNTAATTAGTVATTAHAAATGIATAAQTAFNAVLAANPIGLLAVGLTAVVGTVIAFSDAEEEATDVTDELAKSVEESAQKAEEAVKGVDEATSSWDESIASLNAKEGVADSLVTELYDLEGQSNKTSAEIAQMDMIAGQLNSMFPELSLSVDKNTGALNKNEQQTKSSIDTALKYAKAQAAQEQMADIVNELVEAEMSKYEAEKKLDDIGDQLTALDEERGRIAEEANKKTKESGTALVEYKGEMMDATDAIQMLSTEETELLELQGEQQETVDTLKDAYDTANEKYETAYEYTQGLADKTGDLNEATEEETEKTKENTEAKKENTEANEANAEAKAASQEASAASIEVAGQELTAYQNLSTTQQQLAVDVTNGVLTMKDNVQSALESQMNMFEAFDGGVQLSTQELLNNMQSQIDGVTTWEQNLSSLADRGINQGLLQKLAAMGPEGAGYVQTFVNMSDEELSQANELWGQSVDIQSMTNEWGEQLLTSGAANIAGGMEGLNSLMQASGANTVAGLVAGMQSAQTSATAAGMDLGVKTIESIDSGLGVQSPSRKTKQSGIYLNQGLATGMNSSRSIVQAAAMTVAEAVIGRIDSSLSQARFISIGMNISYGLARGISLGKSQVISVASEVASAAIEAANNKLEIHSPSHVFERMGDYSIQGYVKGVAKNTKAVQKAVADTMNFDSYNGGRSSLAGNVGAKDYTMLKEAFISAASQIKLAVYLNNRDVTRELSNMGVVFNAYV